MTSPDEIAARLTKARADRVAIGSLSAELDAFDLASAYEVQRLLRREAGPLAGCKLGVTSRAKQRPSSTHSTVGWPASWAPSRCWAPKSTRWPTR